MAIDSLIGAPDPNATVDSIMADAMGTTANVLKNGMNLYNTAANVFSDSRSNVQPTGYPGYPGYPGSYNQQPPYPASYAYAYGDTNTNPYFSAPTNNNWGYPGIYNPNYGQPVNGVGGF